MVMVEVPAAVYQARAMARRVEFLSVGSNDLTQYLLAVDRNNARVAGLYHALHPAVLQALQSVADAGKAERVPVGICGEMAGNPAAALLLLAMGYDVLSMNATSLPRVKRAVRSVAFEAARGLLDEVMTMDDATAISTRLDGFLIEHGMAGFIHKPLA